MEASSQMSPQFRCSKIRVDQHSWQSFNGKLRRRLCMRTKHMRTCLSAPRLKCAGKVQALVNVIARAEEHGHHVWLGECRQAPLLWCTKCGGWASHRPQKLLEQCAGTCTRSATIELNRIMLRGSHPKRGIDSLLEGTQKLHAEIAEEVVGGDGS